MTKIQTCLSTLIASILIQMLTSQMARKMKVTGTELSEEEIEDMLEQGRYIRA